MNSIIEDRKYELISLCQSLGVKRLFAFGSAVSDKFTEESDIDFLLSFSEDLSPEEYSENYFTLHYQLRALFAREIDIVTESSLSNPYFIESINETKEMIYEA